MPKDRAGAKSVIIVLNIVFLALLVPWLLFFLGTVITFATGGTAAMILLLILGAVPITTLLSIALSWLYYRLGSYRAAVVLALLPLYNGIIFLAYVAIYFGAALISHQVSTKPTSVTLTSSASAIKAGEFVTLTASVSCGGGPANGTISFFDNQTGLTDAFNLPLSNGQVAVSTSRLESGKRNLTAQYSPSAKCREATSAALVLTVSGAGATTTAISASQSTSGTSTTLEANVLCLGSPGGTMVFYDGQAVLPGADAVALKDGDAQFSTDKLSSGSHSLSAAYSGDSSCAPSRSPALTHVVGSTGFAAGSPTALTVQADSVRSGVTLSASVDCGGKTASGKFSFQDGDSPIRESEADAESNALRKGQAVIHPQGLTPGTHAITASYTGDSACPAGKSPGLTLVLNQPQASSLTLVSSQNPSAPGSYITITAGVACGDNRPTGSVEFSAGGAPLGDQGSALVQQGQAAISTPALPTGNQTITATYSGDDACAASAPASLTQLVQP
jgi:large repetitive protein